MKVRIAALAAALLTAAAPASAQDDVAAFYKGKQVRLIVGSAVGGGYDLYSRALARHMVNHIPGNPTIIVQNQPAAGGMVMTNQLYNQGPQDGTVFSAPLNGIPTAPMLMNGTQFDATKLNWLGSLQQRSLCRVPLAHGAGLAHHGHSDQGSARRLHHGRHDHERLPAAAQRAARLQVQAGARLQGHAADQHRHRARRDPGQCRRRAGFGQDAVADVDRREEDQVHRCNTTCGPPGSCPACRW